MKNYERLYTWNELYNRAIDTACNSRELRAKDNARGWLTLIIFVKCGINIDKCEIPEDEIDYFLQEENKKYLFDENGGFKKTVDSEQYTEAVEVCPHCGQENFYPMWDIGTFGYIATCSYCGQEIFLCDECLHANDNAAQKCDWCETECGGKCFRGTTK